MPLKMGRHPKGNSSSNHWFSAGAMLVSARVNQNALTFGDSVSWDAFSFWSRRPCFFPRGFFLAGLKWLWDHHLAKLCTEVSTFVGKKNWSGTFWYRDIGWKNGGGDYLILVPFFWSGWHQIVPKKHPKHPVFTVGFHSILFFNGRW